MTDTSHPADAVARLSDGSIDYHRYDRRARRIRAEACSRALATGSANAALGLFGPTWTLVRGPAGGTAG